MDLYVTGTTIKRLREARGLTQAKLAASLDVSSKTISKWETAKGFPDISLLEPLAAALGVSVTELLSGTTVVNRNRAGNMLRTKFYVCPICGNVIHAAGEALVSCCGVTLPPLEPEETDAHHTITLEAVEDEQFLSVAHPMTKTHFLSFLAYVTTDRLHLVKLYPEGSASCRFPLQRGGYLYLYCNHHGLMRQKV